MAWQKFEYCEQDTNFPTKIFIIDEYAGFLGSSDRDMKSRRLADRVQQNISQIARLGRSQRIHLIICTQSPTADLFGVDLKGNMAHRLICGRVTDAISNIVLGTEQGATIPARPGSCLDWNLNTEDPVQFQSYFVDKADEVMSLGTKKEKEEEEEEQDTAPEISETSLAEEAPQTEEEKPVLPNNTNEHSKSLKTSEETPIKSEALKEEKKVSRFKAVSNQAKN